MIVRLGYVAISKTLEPLTSSSVITYTNFKKDEDYNKLDAILKKNLESLEKILLYNEKNNIHFYRISSNLIPLATKKEVIFDYIKPYMSYYERIKNILKRTGMRVDMHPSSYCVLNSTKKEVVDTSIDILKYHYNILDAMNVLDKIIILHVGSNVFGKKASLKRFINQFKKLPNYLQKVIAIENDDKIFGVEDCLFLANELKIPVVLDWHHFKCNHGDDNIELYLPEIFNTWRGRRIKMHFSSPRSKKEYRAHHDYIDPSDLISFIGILKKYQRDVDIMIEAKAKDEAVFRLIRYLKYETNYRFVDDTTFDVL